VKTLTHELALAAAIWAPMFVAVFLPIFAAFFLRRSAHKQPYLKRVARKYSIPPLNLR
jgi:hypothetical protein